jgi:ubiquinone/menaquinone biosynthesis C-methylase UbiE
LKYAKSRHTSGEARFVASNVLADEIPRLSYDLVYADQIIEHLVYPEQLLAKLQRTYETGRTARSHNIKTQVTSKYSPTFYRTDVKRVGTSSVHADGDGHFAYTREELMAIFRSAGFSNVRCNLLRSHRSFQGHMKLRYTFTRMCRRRFCVCWISCWKLGIPWLGRRFYISGSGYGRLDRNSMIVVKARSDS